MMSRKPKPTTEQTAAEIAAEAGQALAAVGRFLTGAPLDGINRTDATWTHRGTINTHPENKAVKKWSYLTRWERIGVNWGGLSVAAATAYSYTQAPAATTTGMECSSLSLASIGLSYVGFRTMDGLMTFRHRRDWIWPLHVVLRDRLNLPKGTKPESYLSIPQHFTEITGEAIRIEVPANWGGDETLRSAIQKDVATKLALQDMQFHWNLAGRDHYLSITQSPRPASKVLFADEAVRELVEDCPESAPLIGLSHRGTVVSVDLDSESPHVLVSAGTGGGKSVILRTVFAQLLHNGARGLVLDRKRHSHKWCRGLPQVAYCREIEDIHDALIAAGIEGDRRNRIVDDWEGDDRDAPVGPRYVILLEEVNATVSKLKRYWTEIRGKEDPKNSPAIDALAEILFMGRAVKMHVLAVGQSMTANALGGPEMRENFSTRILARYTRNAWNMLCPEVQPAPKSTRHIGRAQVVLGGVAHETQVMFMTDAEARAWATSGAAVATSQRHSTPIELGKEGVTVTATAPEDAQPAEAGPVRMDSFVADMQAAFGSDLQAPQVPADEEPVSLSQAVKSGVVSLTLVAIRQAAQRDSEFPASVGIHKKTKAKLYLPSQLGKWERNRPSARTAAEDD